MIEDTTTGRSFPSKVLPASSRDLATLGVGWHFDWRGEGSRSEVFKLVEVGFLEMVLGLMAIHRAPGFLEVRLLESSPGNVGQSKRFSGVAGNLLASAADLSFAIGNDGYLKLTSKTELIDHYVKTYGFVRHRSSAILILTPAAALDLIREYPREP